MTGCRIRVFQFTQRFESDSRGADGDSEGFGGGRGVGRHDTVLLEGESTFWRLPPLEAKGKQSVWFGGGYCLAKDSGKEGLGLGLGDL
jgi:hypothetical protein